jgi:hypothetical protein
LLLTGIVIVADGHALAAAVDRPCVVNASVLLRMLEERRSNGSRVVVNFFSSSCPFSAELAPVFDAMPQVCVRPGRRRLRPKLYVCVCVCVCVYVWVCVRACAQARASCHRGVTMLRCLPLLRLGGRSLARRCLIICSKFRADEYR